MVARGSTALRLALPETNTITAAAVSALRLLLGWLEEFGPS